MRYIKITSLQNPIIREAIKIREKRNRYRYEVFVIEGHRLIEMAIASDAEIRRIFFTEKFISKREGQRLLKELFNKGTQLIEVPDYISTKLTDTETPQGVFAIVSYKTKHLEDIHFKGNPFIVVCDGIQDPGNLGTIIRVSDAAGVDAVITLPGTCDVFMPKVIRATAGSLFNISVVHANLDVLTSYFVSRGIKLYVADIHAKKLIYEIDLKQPLAVAFGNEAHGISNAVSKLADDSIKIPIVGKAESLNVATAASVFLYEVVRQRKHPQFREVK